MTFQDFLPILGGFALIALVVVVPFLLLGRRGQAQWTEFQAKWRAIGFTPKRGALTGEHRSRSITMSHAVVLPIRYPDPDEAVIIVRVQVSSPPGCRLSITPKLPQVGKPARIMQSAAPQTQEIVDHFFVKSDPPDLAARLLALPRISAILFSTPKPAVELNKGELRFYRLGGFPDPQGAFALFDVVCDVADLVEQALNSPDAD